MKQRLFMSECTLKCKVVLVFGYLLYLLSIIILLIHGFSTNPFIIGPVKVEGHFFADSILQIQILMLVGFILLGGYKTFLTATILNIFGFITCMIIAVVNKNINIIPEILSYVTTGIVIALIYTYKSKVKIQFEELISKEKALQKMAYFDGLTNILNRKIFIQVLQERIVEYGEKQEDFYVIFLDIDDFKSVNDKMGHYYGDLLLKELSYRIMRHLKDQDSIGRLGGDELGLLIYADKDAQVIDILKKIKAEILRTYRFDGKELQATVSMGVAHFPLDGHTSTELLKNADMAMYQSKTAGKNSISIYGQERAVF